MCDAEKSLYTKLTLDMYKRLNRKMYASESDLHDFGINTLTHFNTTMRDGHCGVTGEYRHDRRKVGPCQCHWPSSGNHAQTSLAPAAKRVGINQHDICHPTSLPKQLLTEQNGEFKHTDFAG